MTLASTEHNYKIAKSLYNDISDDFYAIENDGKDDDYMIDQTLEDIKKLNRHINRINLDDLEDGYDTDVLDILANNIDTFREASYFIERALMSAKLFDKIHPVLEQYLKKVDWHAIADDLDEAVKKFGRFLTNENNYEQYKTIIWNIVKGTMQKRSFANFFNTVKSRIGRSTPVAVTKQRNPLPPQMWPEKEQEEWKKMKEKAKKEAEESEEDDQFKEKDFESFITLKDFGKLND